MNLSYYLTYDLPVPYRNIKVYPVTVKDYILFNLYSQCFLLDKNSIPDAKIISMTELEYIYRATEGDAENKPYLLWLDRLFSLCFKEEDSFERIETSIGRYRMDGNRKPLFFIREEEYTSKDYDELKSIICEQNYIELPDESISKEVRDSLEKAQEYKNRISGVKPATLEDYFVSLSTVTGWTIDYIHSMTIRKFIKSIRRLDNYVHYRIYLAASMSGMVEFKDKSFIKHWLTNLDETDKYKDVTVNLDEMQKKVSLESAKQ